MARNPEIRHLLSLLDDEDESIAVDAMAELLFREEELGDALAELQESPNPLFRRRGHQLQAAITLRRRRRGFIRKLRAPRVDLIDGLIDVHLQWYDNDSRPELEMLWNKFRLDAARCPLRSLEELAYFMRKSGFTAQQETTLRPENYCIGPILENHTGSAALLAGISAAAAAASFRMVRVMGDFALYDGDGQLLVPAHDWQLCPAPGIGLCEFWDPRMLLRYASTTLFSCAVNSDSFRYVLTIAQALSGTTGNETLDYLPYPYRPAADEPESGTPEESGKNPAR